MAHFFLPTDTSPDALRVQFRILRRLSPATRIAWVDELSDFVRQSALEALRRLHPNSPDEEIVEKFFRLRLSRENAEEVLCARRRMALDDETL